MKTALMASAVAMMMGGLMSLAAADFKAPRTPWGEPDLEGTWTSQAELGVPFERPAEFGTRERLTDEEFAQREAQAQNQLKSDNADFDPGVGGHLACGPGGVGHVAAPDLARARQGLQAHVDRHRSPGRPGPGDLARRRAPSARGGPGRARQRTVRRPGGHGPLPAVHHARRAERDLSGGLQRQHAHRAGPGFVAITYEMIHETRVIPTTPRPHLTTVSGSTWATREGTGRAPPRGRRRRTSTRRTTIADRAPACTWSNATRGRPTRACGTR